MEDTASMDRARLWDLDAIASTPLEPRVLSERTVGRGRTRVVRREMRYYSHGGEYVGTIKVGSDALTHAALYAEAEWAGGPFLTSVPWLGPGFREVMRPFPENGT